MSAETGCLVLGFHSLQFDDAWRRTPDTDGGLVVYRLRDPEEPGRVRVVATDGRTVERNVVQGSVIVDGSVVHLPRLLEEEVAYLEDILIPE